MPEALLASGAGIWVNTAYFRRFDFSGVLLPLCSVSFFESVFLMA